MAHSFLDAQKNIINTYKNFDIDMLLSNQMTKGQISRPT